jgi:superfamily II DNA or RNA helicase
MSVEEPAAPSAPTVLAEATWLREAATYALARAADRRHEATRAYEAARDEVLARQLAEMPIARLRETTSGGVRFAALERAGIKTVADALKHGWLIGYDGVGEHTNVQVQAAARQLALAMKDGLRLRFEVDRRPAEQTDLLEALTNLELIGRMIAPVYDDLGPLMASLERLEKPAKRAASPVRMFFSGRRKRDSARDAVAQLGALIERSSTQELSEKLEEMLPKLDPEPAQGDFWASYEQRVAAYNGLLVEVGGLATDQSAAQGFVPSELANLVHEHPLDTELLNVSLRGYQAFGAKFALQQRRAILGDEMGLGKTIEALAAMCHLSTQGASHFLVICPASVLVNWLHEVERHSDLAAVRLHGADRDSNFRMWARRGGVGVTTFQSLHWLYQRDFDLSPAMLVVDEAHYVKNPRARRSLAVNDFMKFSERTLFLTGTPMENRVEEFRALVGHLEPKIAARINVLDGLAGAAAFRTAVAPVYLRRNQEDVLQELPEKIETEEWVALEDEDFDAYRSAVAEGSFMAMRQAAYLPGTATGSAKLTRLLEIAEEAIENGRKVIVFSFFRAVLQTVASALGDATIGTITGSVPPTRRQQLVDDFTKASDACVLVSQIEAGGVGLNIQAASVVILTEPQWKPSTEDQAVARCHRMGQARSVDVHRLLAEDSVDQRMLEILATKSALFDEYVRRSALKEISADSIDISNLDAAKEVASVAEEERRIIEVERRRLGIETDTVAVAAVEE